jgi:hypothetical protein
MAPKRIATIVARLKVHLFSGYLSFEAKATISLSGPGEASDFGPLASWGVDGGQKWLVRRGQSED